uniref:16.4 kDa salivary protein n=1 Tax=Lutzomyia longipalpis TaxID=7200 RepID=Q5WPU6_LUTLO|nr:16.4 kDa salivary protein [Lutzomyia longipalpis]
MKFYIFGVFLVSFLALCNAEDYDKVKLTGRTVYISRSKAPWFTALDNCNRLRFTFAMIKSQKENEELTNALLSVIKSDEENVWIGGLRHDLDDYFRWISFGTALSKTSYTNWAPKEPTGRPHRTQNDEFCMQMSFKDGGKWSDNTCWRKRLYVCEKRD